MQANAVEPTRSYGGDPANANVHAPAPSSQPTNQPSSPEPIPHRLKRCWIYSCATICPWTTNSADKREIRLDLAVLTIVELQPYIKRTGVPGGQPTVNSDSPRVNNYDASHNTAVNPVQSQPGVNNSEPSRPTTYGGSTTNYQGTAPAPQPVANNDQPRSTTYDNSNASTIAHGPAPVAQPGVNNEPARVTNYDGGTVSSNPQPGYQPQQPQQPPQPQPQPQPGSQDVMRTASYDNSSTVNPQGTGTPLHAQPPAQQYTGETVRGTSFTTTLAALQTLSIRPIPDSPISSPGSSEQPRVTGDSTASANTTQYNSTQHVTPPVGPNQVSNSETPCGQLIVVVASLAQLVVVLHPLHD